MQRFGARLALSSPFIFVYLGSVQAYAQQAPSSEPSAQAEPPSSPPDTESAPSPAPSSPPDAIPASPSPDVSPAPSVPADAGSTPAPASPPPRARYSLPFQLRAVTAATVVRSDTSFASYENAAGLGGFTVVSELTGAYRVPGTGSAPGTGLAPLVKLTIVNDSPPGTATGGFAFVNPLIGASYALSFGSGWRGSAFLAVTIPVGMGGGDKPDPGPFDARSAGPAARADMDNALFSVDDLAVIPGIDVAYVAHGLTAQIEATLFQLERVRGAAQQPEASKTNFTGGVHVGYYLIDALSLGAEVRLQLWLNAPLAVDAHKPNTSFDMVSFGVGPRLHLHVAGDVWLHPGVSYSRGFDHPLTSPGNYNIVQLDVPVVF